MDIRTGLRPTPITKDVHRQQVQGIGGRIRDRNAAKAEERRSRHCEQPQQQREDDLRGDELERAGPRDEHVADHPAGHLDHVADQLPSQQLHHRHELLREHGQDQPLAQAIQGQRRRGRRRQDEAHALPDLPPHVHHRWQFRKPRQQIERKRRRGEREVRVAELDRGVPVAGELQAEGARDVVANEDLRGRHRNDGRQGHEHKAPQVGRDPAIHRSPEVPDPKPHVGAAREHGDQQQASLARKCSTRSGRRATPTAGSASRRAPGRAQLLQC